MQDENEGALKMLELGNDPPHDIVDHALPRNLFMANLWIGSGDHFYCTYASRGEGGFAKSLCSTMGLLVTVMSFCIMEGGGGPKKAGILCASYTMWMVTGNKGNGVLG